MAKLFRIRKPKLRLTSKGLKVSNPSARIGGKIGMNISSRGINPSIHSGRRRKKDGCLSLFILPLLLLMLVQLACATSTSTSASDNDKDWVSMSGNIYTGVKVYMGTGEDKSFAFTVLGGNENCSFGRGLYVEFPSGSKEWKDRSALISGDSLFIKTDDPALEEMDWRTFPCP